MYEETVSHIDTELFVYCLQDGVKELQYIELDHSDSSSYRSQSTESLASRPVEYVDIDFTKKAFIAPKRYPPPPSPNRKTAINSALNIDQSKTKVRK